MYNSPRVMDIFQPIVEKREVEFMFGLKHFFMNQFWERKTRGFKDLG